jgi:hypothetical protein
MQEHIVRHLRVVGLDQGIARCRVAAQIVLPSGDGGVDEGPDQLRVVRMRLSEARIRFP